MGPSSHAVNKEEAMTTTTISTRERNEAVWTQSAKLLYTGRLDEFLAYWQHDARYEVAYPIEGFPAVVEGRAALGELFAAFTAATERITVHDVRFHQTDDPDVAFVEERMTAELVGGGSYENDLVIRVTFRDGLIAELYEYYGERAHEDMLRRLEFTA
jgi:ketosteroid isomerase-like protein